MNTLFNSRKKILITGGAGFIGSHLIKKLLIDTKNIIFNLDKLGYASNLSNVENLIMSMSKEDKLRYKFVKLDLLDKKSLISLVNQIKPDMVFHLAAESHVDRSIDDSSSFIESNIIGTYNLLEAVRQYLDLNLHNNEFKLIHISTDEVFGSLNDNGDFFNESTKYDPRSPYSASKACSDHLVQSWFHTYGLPVLISNCSNNYGPWQFPEKLIPLAISKALKNDEIPLYGEGKNIRDWLFVEDHVNALIKIADKGKVGKKYCIGGSNEKSNKEVLQELCKILDKFRPEFAPHFSLVKNVKDRPGHDYRYAIDHRLITEELGWKPMNNFSVGLEKTVQWYLMNQDWLEDVIRNSGYFGTRLGT